MRGGGAALPLVKCKPLANVDFGPAQNAPGQTREGPAR